MSLRTWLLSALFLIGLALSLWLYSHSLAPKTGQRANEGQADFYLVQLRNKRFDKKGRLIQQLTAENAAHYPTNDTTDFIKPHIILFKTQEKPWTIDSDFARSIDAFNQITFQDNVRLHQANGVNNPPTTILTQRLIYQPNKRYAETARPITLLQPGTEVKSVGMHAYLNEGRVELLSKAEGKYAN